MISGQRSYKRFLKNYTKLPIIPRKCTSTNLTGVLSRKIHTKFEANQYSRFREVEKVKKVHDNNNYHNVEHYDHKVHSHSLHECD